MEGVHSCATLNKTNVLFEIVSIPDCSFPYIVIIISMMTSASHFSIKINQSAPALLIMSLRNTRNLVILIGHWLVHAYGIISLTGLKELWYLSLVPAPALFYILTAQFTDPMKIHNDWRTEGLKSHLESRVGSGSDARVYNVRSWVRGRHHRNR